VPKTSSGVPTRDDVPERTWYLPSDLRAAFGSTCGETRSRWRPRNPGQQSNWGFRHPQAPTDDFVGAVGLRPIDWKNRKAVAGYWVAAWARNEGVATKALTLVTGWAFRHVGLQLVELQTMIGNRASERVAEKAGFDLVATVSDAEHPIAEGERFNVKRWTLRQA
jgi:RimJ/RimL family protein N-acetyltransferase